MSRRDRQRAEIEQLCLAGASARAIDLTFTHFADFGRDDELLALVADALDRGTVTPVVRRRFAELLAGGV